MQYAQMIDGVCQRVQVSREDAGTILAATVQALGETAGAEMADLSAQLPGELERVTSAGSASQRSADEFVVRIGDLTGVDDADRARQYAEAGFGVLAESVSAGQMRQLVESLPPEVSALAPSVAGLTKPDEALFDEVRREAGLDTFEQARELTHAVLAVLAEATSAGQTGDLAAVLPDDTAEALRTSAKAGHSDPDRFLDEVTSRSPVTIPELARDHVTAVFGALRRWAPTELDDTLSQLPKEIARL